MYQASQRQRAEPPFLLSELLAEHGGEVDADIDGVRIERLSSIEAAGPGSLAFLIEQRYRPRDGRFGGTALVLSKRDVGLRCLQWLHPNPTQLWQDLAERFRAWSQRRWPGVSAHAWLDPSVSIGHDVDIAPGVVLGPRVVIGDGCCLGPNVVVEEGVQMGARCRVEAQVYLGPGTLLGDEVRLGPGCVIADQGFGYRQPSGQTTLRRVEHIGGVLIGDDVEFGALCCVDAGSLEPTRIGSGCRIDNLVHIAHNVVLEPGCVLLAQVGLAGRVRVGAGCILAGQVGVAPGLHLGAGTQLAAQSGLAHSTHPGARLAGSPAFDVGSWRRMSVRLPQLDVLHRELESLRVAVARLEAAAVQAPMASAPELQAHNGGPSDAHQGASLLLQVSAEQVGETGQAPNGQEVSEVRHESVSVAGASDAPAQRCEGLARANECNQLGGTGQAPNRQELGETGQAPDQQKERHD
ncbi:MAG: UDP-3-O-(3-hydroxymyristoyl)glucosamine N-acyltransferase [Myxococcota bacterium]|nr:UDP-3-O-(3-hydroxymyristoyl)glucosamine N-acyltransferase [Myxococcota bacterium]